MAETRETIHLMVPDGDAGIYIDRVESPQRIRVAASLGAREPLHVSAVGKACGQAGLHSDQLLHVVVGCPGAVNPANGELAYAPHLPGWSGFDLPGRLREQLATSVSVENDVNLVALEEMVAGRPERALDALHAGGAITILAGLACSVVLILGAALPLRTMPDALCPSITVCRIGRDAPCELIPTVPQRSRAPSTMLAASFVPSRYRMSPNIPGAGVRD